MTDNLQFGVAEGILAKQALAEIDEVFWLGEGTIVPIRDEVRDSMRTLLGVVVAGGMLCVAGQTASLQIKRSPSTFGYCSVGFLPECCEQSDSQLLSRRQIRANDAARINRQAKEHDARVFAFERPFLAESPSAPAPTRDVSRVLKLRKRT